MPLSIRTDGHGVSGVPNEPELEALRRVADQAKTKGAHDHDAIHHGSPSAISGGSCMGSGLMDDVISSRFGGSAADIGPDPARVRHGVGELQRAMKGLGTDEDAIYHVFESYSPSEVVAIEREFNRVHGGEWGSLRNALYGELSGPELGRALNALDGSYYRAAGTNTVPNAGDPFVARQVAGAEELHRAMKGLGTDEGAIFRLLETSPPEMVVGIEAEFNRLHGREWGSLRSAIYSEMSGIERHRALASLDLAHLTAARGMRPVYEPSCVPTPLLPPPAMRNRVCFPPNYADLNPIRDGLSLLRGMAGPAVMALQCCLFQLGLPSELDGIFGARTEASLRHFQGMCGLMNDGICSPATLAWGFDRRFGCGGAVGANGFEPARFRPPACPAVDPTRVQHGAYLLDQAMRGLGTDERAIFAVLENRPPHEVVAIAQEFQRTYGGRWGSLHMALYSELSGPELGRAVSALDRAIVTTMAGPGAPLPRPPCPRLAQALCSVEQLHGAMKGLGTDEEAINRILEGSSPEDLALIEREFSRAYGHEWGSLRSALHSELSGGELDRAVRALDAKLAVGRW